MASLLDQTTDIRSDFFPRLRELAKTSNVAFKTLALCFRIGLSNSLQSPSLPTLIELLGVNSAQVRLLDLARLLESLDWTWLQEIENLISRCHEVFPNVTAVKEFPKNLVTKGVRLQRGIEILSQLQENLNKVKEGMCEVRNQYIEDAIVSLERSTI